jgi:hypothetical protein
MSEFVFIPARGTGNAAYIRRMDIVAVRELDDSITIHTTNTQFFHKISRQHFTLEEVMQRIYGDDKQ